MSFPLSEIKVAAGIVGARFCCVDQTGYHDSYATVKTGCVYDRPEYPGDAPTPHVWVMGLTGSDHGNWEPLTNLVRDCVEIELPNGTNTTADESARRTLRGQN